MSSTTRKMMKTRFSQRRKKPSLKTYDIIRRLTSDDKSKRSGETSGTDIRSVTAEKISKSRNLTKPVSRDCKKIFADLPYVNTMPSHRSSRMFDKNLPGKLSSSLIERKSSKNISSLVGQRVSIGRKTMPARRPMILNRGRRVSNRIATSTWIPRITRRILLRLESRRTQAYLTIFEKLSQIFFLLFFFEIWIATTNWGTMLFLSEIDVKYLTSGRNRMKRAWVDRRVVLGLAGRNRW